MKFFLQIILTITVLFSVGLYFFYRYEMPIVEKNNQELSSANESKNNYEIDISREEVSNNIFEGEKKLNPEVNKSISIEFDEDIKYLLEAEIGFINNVQISERIDNLKKKNEEVRGSVNKLLNSKSESERLLGVYLYLEIFGNDSNITAFVKDSDSFHIKADFAKWLYRHSNFLEWENFTHSELANLNEAEINNFFSIMQNTEGVMLNIGATMSSLELGGRDKGADRFMEQLLHRNPLALHMAEKRKTSNYRSSADHLNNIYINYLYNRDFEISKEDEDRIMNDSNQYFKYLEIARINQKHIPSEKDLIKIKETLDQYVKMYGNQDSWAYSDLEYLLWKY